MQPSDAGKAGAPRQVFFVLNSLAPGGTEHSTLVLASRLPQQDVVPTIILMKPAAHALDRLASELGVAVRPLRATGFLGQVRELRTLLRQERPAVLHTALFAADQLGRIAAARLGIPVVSSLVSTPYDPGRLHDPNIRRWRLRSVQLVDALTIRLFVDRLHAVSDGVKEANAQALRIAPNRIIVAERGRDASSLGAPSAERRAAVRARLGIDDRAPVVLSLGRLEHLKGHLDLIASVKILRASYPNVTVLLAGKDGSASESIRHALDDDRTTASHIRLLGHRSDVGDLLCASDVLVISSHLEGTAGVALEAMAMRTPIVSTDLDGVRGVLRHDENAVLAPVRRPELLAAAIARVFDDPGLAARITARGARDFEERFTLDAAARRLADLYDDVLHDG